MGQEIKKGTEIAMIDAALVVMRTKSGKNIGLDTASQVEVAIASETQEAVKLIIKNKLRAQKKATTTVTGHTITLTDNVFNFEQAKIIQGGTLSYWTSAEKTSKGEEVTEFGIAGYKPPVVGSDDKGEEFDLDIYSAVYDASGEIVEYEKITYPNCTGQPFGIGAQDNAFHVSSITIDSAPAVGESPYSIESVTTLPVVS